VRSPNSATNPRCGSWRGKQWPSLAAKSRRQERRSGERWLRASGFQQRRSWGGKALCAWVPSIKYPTPPGLCDWNCGQNVNMEPRRAAAPHESHRPEAPRLTASVTASLRPARPPKNSLMAGRHVQQRPGSLAAAEEKLGEISLGTGQASHDAGMAPATTSP
jgi:hypothetical protein